MSAASRLTEGEFRLRVETMARELKDVLSRDPIGEVGIEALAHMLGSGARLAGVRLELVKRAVEASYAQAPGPMRAGARLVPRD